MSAHAHRFGAWQFLSDLPYQHVTVSSMWRLLWKMHLPDNRPLFALDCDVIRSELSERDSLLAFEDRLVNMAASEALYLLNTFANMARTRSASDAHFIVLVLLEIFEVAVLEFNGGIRKEYLNWALPLITLTMTLTICEILS